METSLLRAMPLALNDWGESDMELEGFAGPCGMASSVKGGAGSPAFTKPGEI